MAGFHPRRLAHVNLWVSELEASVAFYERSCGIHLVRRERDLIAGFHSNGNTHHDIGLIEISRGVDRVGRDGKIQIPKTRGVKVEMNHLGWEMESEVQLVEAYQRLLALGLEPRYLADHLISHSVYVLDPDGNSHEFYADAIPDWREIYNLEHDDLVTADWDPLAGPPSDAKYHPVDPELRGVPNAPVQPMRVTGATIATRRFDEMCRFFTEVAGLEIAEEAQMPRRAVFSGSCGWFDMTLVEAAANEPVGLRLFSFQLPDGSDIDMAASRLAAVAGAEPKLVDDARRRSIVVNDPDGYKVEFYVPKTAQAVEPLAFA